MSLTDPASFEHQDTSAYICASIITAICLLSWILFTNLLIAPFPKLLIPILTMFIFCISQSLMAVTSIINLQGIPLSDLTLHILITSLITTYSLGQSLMTITFLH